MALAGSDGERAEQLLANARQEGAQVIAELTKRAVKRLLAGPSPMTATSLFTQSEQEEVAAALAATTATANLLGRARIHVRAEKAVAGTQHADHGTDYSRFDEGDGLKPLDPLDAVAKFVRQVPTLSIDPEQFSTRMRTESFKLAATTDATILAKVQNLIGKLLDTGKGISTAPARVDALLTEAGLSPKNPSYPDTVVRTNMMTAFQRGTDEELAEPTMQEEFPVWRFAGIADGRERPAHRAHFDKYFPSIVTFEEVRDAIKGTFDGYNCRCILPGHYIGGSVRKALKGWYAGQAIELVTAKGARLAVTANHPVLSARGFVAAAQFQVGDNLVCHVGENQRLRAGDDIENGPALIENVFSSFPQCNALRIAKRWTALDFHGDGAAFYGDVDVVTAGRDLGLDPDAHSTEHCCQGLFGRCDVEKLGLSRCCPSDRGGRLLSRCRRASQRYTGSQESVRQRVSRNADFLREGVDGFAGQVSFRQPWPVHKRVVCGFCRPANFNARIDKLTPESFVLNSSLLAEARKRFASAVPLDELVEAVDFLGDTQVANFRPCAKRGHLGKGLSHSRQLNAGFPGQIGEHFAGVVSSGKRLNVANVLGHFQPSRFGLASKLNTLAPEPNADGGTADAQFLAELMKGFSGQVIFDQLRSIRRFHYDGPVYDLETTTGHYTSGASPSAMLVVHNCVRIPVYRTEWAKLQAAGARAEVAF